MSKVQIVLCMDTEGPCDDPNNHSLLKTWDSVDSAMDKLFEKKFRNQYPDSAGNGFKIGWFFLTWTGFKTNSRNRDFGFHKVRDHYQERWGGRLEEYSDEHCWHYHHPAESGIGDEWGMDWNICREYEEIISRQILERRWFPVCYRAGGTVMTPQSSRWIDSWFPFDFSNRAPLSIPNLVDWSAGINDWVLYHPDIEDFRKPGAGNRIMARCLDLVTGVYILRDAEIHKAFQLAQAGTPALLSVFDHDYRDMADRIENLCKRITEISRLYPSVSWQYATPAAAVRQCLGMTPSRGIKINSINVNNTVRVWSTAPLFQHIPWIAIELEDGSVIHCYDKILRVSSTEWMWRIPDSLRWNRVGIAGSTVEGCSDISIILRDEKPMQDFFNQPLDEHPLFPHNIEYHSKLLVELCIRRASGEAEDMDAVRQAVEVLQPYIEKNCTLLDVGCSAGQAWLSFRHLGVEYFGIDDYKTAVEIAKAYLPETGLSAGNIRWLAVENLSSTECFDCVICLYKFRYFPSFRLPLEIMARATRKVLVIRGTFGIHRNERYLPDVLLEPGFQSMRASFNIYSKAEIEDFLRKEGFKVRWVPDKRQAERFDGGPETVGGIEFFYEFLVAERTSLVPPESDILGEYWREQAKLWSHEGKGLPFHNQRR